MKTNREPRRVTTKARFGPFTFQWPIRLRGTRAALVMLGVLQLWPIASNSLAESSAGRRGEGAQRWSVEVDKVNPGDVGLEPTFGVAIYENLLQELAKTEQFKQLFRCGDRGANGVLNLLILKTTVQKYTPGSDTRRAVTTVNGATKLNVRIELVTREGHVALESIVTGNVRFFGDNLRATHTLARNVAATLARSTLPEQAEPIRALGTQKTLK